MAKKKLTATQKLRKNLLSAVRRRSTKYDISEDFIEYLKNASYQTLKSYSNNRYKKLDRELQNYSTPTEVVQEVTQIAQPIDFTEKILDDVLSHKKVTSKSEQARNYYRNLIKEALEYDNVNELINALRNTEKGTYEYDRLNAIYHIVLETPNLYNKVAYDNKPEPNDFNTAKTSTLVWASIMNMIDTALGGGSKWEKYLADYLRNALYEELDRYADEQWKVYKAIEISDGWLIDNCYDYIYDSSENLEAKKAHLESILTEIRGRIPGDDERIELSEFTDMYDGYEEP